MNRKAYDKVMKSITYIATSFTAIILLAIVAFTFTRGTALLSWDLVTGDYHSVSYSIDINDFNDELCNCEYEGVLEDDSFYSEKWGVVLTDTQDTDGSDIIQITYIDDESPFNFGHDIAGNDTSISENSYLTGTFQTIKEDGSFGSAGLTSRGSESVVEVMEQANAITGLQLSTPGGGIRGSIVSTLWLILITLVIAVPFGVLTAIYMNEYTRKNKFINILGTLIDTLTGVPSIIFGLLGAAVFIPMVNNMSGTVGNYGSIVAGALTMSVILLPVIVKTTRQALNQVPKDLRSASLALGANTTQTTFKVVLGNSIPGIISGVILGIGRIVGESAALIFAMGTLISDNPELFDRSTSLAVHIWTIMSLEEPNFELASAIALIILTLVLILNVSVKMISKKFNKMGRA